MNKLSSERRAMILSVLVEGISVNATARICRVSKITVLRLLADVGTFCAQFQELHLRNLSSRRVQVDEIWSFVYCKQKNMRMENWGKGHGDAWTWVGIDADTKLAICWEVGGRDSESGRAFIWNLADRLAHRVQLTSDGHRVYLDAVERAFGDDVDCAMLVKLYGSTTGAGPESRYSPPVCVAARPERVTGDPDPDHISTSFVERQNLTMRMGMRRFARLTNAFSKRLANHEHALALHFFFYNFCRKHQTLKTTPAVASGLADRAWTVLDLVAAVEDEEGCMSAYAAWRSRCPPNQ